MSLPKGFKHTEETKKKISLAHKGKSNWHKGRTLTEEHKRKIGESNKGKTKGRISLKKGKTFEEMYGIEKAIKMKERHNEAVRGHTAWNKGTKGVMPASWNKGLHPEYMQGENHHFYGKHHSETTRLKISNNRKGKCVGKENTNWKGTTSLYERIRKLPESEQWRESVYKKDNFTCQTCGDKKGGNLHAHHKREFAIILAEFLKEYDQFSPYEDIYTLVRLAMKWQPFWDIDNGETQCKKCHIEIHKKTKALL